MTRGVFITLEGGEGVGKTTLLDGLKRVLAREEREIIFTREPGGTPGAEALRQVLLDHVTASVPMSAETEALIICTARSLHVDELILPALSRGAIIICDRFSDSTRAYQGNKIEADQLESLISLATKGLEPDLTLLLDADPEILSARRRDRRGDQDRFEIRDQRFHTNVRQRFLDGAKNAPHRIVIVNAELQPQHVLQKCLETLNDRFSLMLNMPDPATDP